MFSLHLVFRHATTAVFSVVVWEMLKWHWRNRVHMFRSKGRLARHWGPFSRVPFPDEES